MTEPMTGQLEAIWIKPGRRQAMSERRQARLVAEQGIDGNADQGGRRQVTVLSADQWEEVQRELGAEVDPKLRRANLLVRGLDLRESRGRTLRIGGTRLRIRGETRPCRLMEEAHPGLQQKLEPEWRGGAYGVVVAGGDISVGDEVSWENDLAGQPST